MKKTAVSSNSLGAFLSPGAPNYSDNKGWSSERVPHPSTAGINGGRRHVSSSSAFATPFYSARALPSKWEDAERWICSPVASKNSQFVLERTSPKSKSGPIVPPPPLPLLPPSSSSETGCCHSPAVKAPRGSMMFSTGVLEAERVFRGSNVGGCDGWIDLVSESSSSSSKEEKPKETKEAETTLSPVISRRDMATQMSPDSYQSPQETEASPLYTSSPVVVPIVEPHSENLCRQEVREVKIDRRARMIKRPKRRVSRVSKREQPEAQDVYINSGVYSSSWDVSETAMSLSKLHREEAKIAAWENLQKAKAEAAIRKLEVKLEKKKSESIDKILNKLQTAQVKAQEMRSSISSSKEANHISRNPLKITHLRRHTFMNPFMSCFAPHVDRQTSSTV